MHKLNTPFLTFFLPDYTVGPGVSPDHVQVVLVGCDHRSGIVRNLLCTHPAPKVVIQLCKLYQIKVEIGVKRWANYSTISCQ